MSRLFKIFIKRNIVMNAITVSFVVGAVLNIINQGEAFVNGQPLQWGHVLLNFLVPYCVASYSAAKNEMEKV